MKRNRKRGSSTVMLALVFVTFSLCITASISITRALAVKSECEIFGRVWVKAILSEYDRHLLKDYGIMAYWGNEAEVQKRIDSYMNYSMASKLDASIGGASAELTGYELGNPENFRKALNKGLSSGIADSMKNGSRIKREEEPGMRYIRNKIVIDTLPSRGMSSSISSDRIKDEIEKTDGKWTAADALKSEASELMVIHNTMSNRVTRSSGKAGYLSCEWEYIVAGHCDDEENCKDVDARLFVVRNVLNLAALYKDPAKVEVITSAAALITPGPGAVVTQAVIAEAWAAAETKADMDRLHDNKRVPFIKTSATWQTGLGSVLNSDDVTEKLDEEGKQLLDENLDTILDMDGAGGVAEELSEGQTYDDYLMLMIVLMNDNVRLLRVMDIIQINMKFRYYEDFNMMEYYTGVAYTIQAGMRNYEFKDSYN